MDFELSGKKCLVTGASGFIGQNVALRLLNEKASVRALVRNRARAVFLEESGVEIFQGDITDRATIQQAVKECDAVFHLAAVTNEFKPLSYYHEVNIGGSLILAEEALKAGVRRFVHISTSWVYGMFSGRDITENSPRLKSGHLYADTKLETEDLIRQLYEKQNLPCVIIQPSEVYGPNDKNWTGRPLELIRSGRMLLINRGSGLIQPIYIDDLVEGIIAAARRGRLGESYILCGNEVVTFKQYFGYFTRMLHKKHLPSVPGWAAITLAALSEWLGTISHRPPIFTRSEIKSSMTTVAFNGAKAFKELGFQPKVSLEKGMAKIGEWLKIKESSTNPPASHR
jgi:nucleoside-diphosphate-sugar epimerase